jgi:hypothetical protein
MNSQNGCARNSRWSLGGTLIAEGRRFLGVHETHQIWAAGVPTILNVVRTKLGKGPSAYPPLTSQQKRHRVLLAFFIP